MRPGLGLILIAILLQGCATQSLAPELNSKTVYRMDLGLEVNGQKSEGLLLVAPDFTYRVKVTSKLPADLVTMKTCQREVELVKQKLEFTIDYRPSEVERTYCPAIEFRVFNEKHWYQGGMVEVSDPLMTMQASTDCNGVRVSSVIGTALCQVRTDLIQQIRFLSVMNDPRPSPACSPAETTDHMTYRIRPFAGECHYLFEEDKPTSAKRFHLIIYGYEDYSR